MGDWVLGDKLGEGQFAKVFACRKRDGMDQRDFALKVGRPFTICGRLFWFVWASSSSLMVYATPSIACHSLSHTHMETPTTANDNATNR